MLASLISDLSLTQKLDLKRAGKRLNKCLDQILAKEQSILFVGTYGKGLDVWTPRHKDRIELKKIGHKFNDDNQWLKNLMTKLPNIRAIRLDNNIWISNEMLEWLFKQSPLTESLSLLDYRLDYHTFNWESLANSLSDRLVYLQIECRLNQHISGKRLAELVAKLYRLRELSIVNPHRRLESLFESFGPNIRKLEIQYSKPLDADETHALINGNGRHLQELAIQYRSSATKAQNYQFSAFCKYLLDLKSFTFNNCELSNEALGLVVELTNLKRFKYNYNGNICNDNQRYQKNPMRGLDLRALARPMPSLQSLTLTNIVMIPQHMYHWKALFPNLRHLYLKCLFACGCYPSLNLNYQCNYCLKLCFMYISELPFLRWVTFAEPSNVYDVPYFNLLTNISFLEVNMCGCPDGRFLQSSVLPTLIQMANQRTNASSGALSVRLYDFQFDPTPKLRKRFPRNLKITFANDQ